MPRKQQAHYTCYHCKQVFPTGEMVYVSGVGGGRGRHFHTDHLAAMQAGRNGVCIACGYSEESARKLLEGRPRDGNYVITKVGTMHVSTCGYCGVEVPSGNDETPTDDIEVVGVVRVPQISKRGGAE